LELSSAEQGTTAYRRKKAQRFDGFAAFDISRQLTILFEPKIG